MRQIKGLHLPQGKPLFVPDRIRRKARIVSHHIEGDQVRFFIQIETPKKATKETQVLVPLQSVREPAAVATAIEHAIDFLEDEAMLNLYLNAEMEY